MIPSINPYKTKPQNNWVLIKPSDDIFRIQAKDRSGLHIDVTWDPYLHPVIYGEIMALPEKLDYKTWDEMKQWSRDEHEMFGDRLSIDPGEIHARVGDKVYFDYIACQNALEHGRMIRWENCVYIFVRYDLLLAVIRDEEFISLNGWIFYDKIKSDDDEERNQEAGVEIGYEYNAKMEQIPKLVHTTDRYKRQSGKVMACSDAERTFWNSNLTQKDYYIPHNETFPPNVISFDKKTDLKLENDDAIENDIAWRRVQEVNVMGYWTQKNGMDLNRGRIMVIPDDLSNVSENGLLLTEQHKRFGVEGTVSKICTTYGKMGTWFDDIEAGDRVKFNINDPSMNVTIDGKDYVVLSPKNIVYITKKI